MNQASPPPALLFEAPLDKSSTAAPMQRQLHHRIKDAILDGRLPPGGLLPGTRNLAAELAISRNTVIAAYDLLAAEGYVVGSHSGTRVAELHRAGTAPSLEAAQMHQVMAGRLSEFQPSLPHNASISALRPGMPALSHFPLSAWRRMLDTAIRRAGASALGYGDPLGEAPLRAAIARHLGVSRGVRCQPEQVVITEGAQEALMLCVRLLSNPGDTVWLEDPGYRGAKAAFQAGDLRLHPLRGDDEGIIFQESDWQAQPPRLIYTTPAHQYPGGAVLSVSRRLQLIATARQHGTWIIEDDYDSEFRHSGESIAAMQGLLAQAPVLYVGTFSKTMFPSLRLGFLVLPDTLLSQVQTPLAEMLRGGHRYEQLALAEFIEAGHFTRHLGRMRRLYRERQHALRLALAQHMAVEHQIMGGHSGLHLTIKFPAHYPDKKIAEAARRYGMSPSALSSFALQPMPEDNGLVLGYGNTSAEVFAPLVQRLSRLLIEMKSG